MLYYIARALCVLPTIYDGCVQCKLILSYSVVCHPGQNNQRRIFKHSVQPQGFQYTLLLNAIIVNHSAFSLHFCNERGRFIVQFPKSIFLHTINTTLRVSLSLDNLTNLYHYRPYLHLHTLHLQINTEHSPLAAIGQTISCIDNAHSARVISLTP